LRALTPIGGDLQLAKHAAQHDHHRTLERQLRQPRRQFADRAGD
jgi:hypothetical protein